MKKLILSILILGGALSFSGCAPSQEQLLLKKQQKEKARLEKIAIQQKAKALEIKIYKEAEQYLDSSNDNKLIWDLLEQNNNKYKKSPYESDSEYKQRVTNLNAQIVNRKFIFDYQSEYIMYDPNKDILGLVFNVINKKKWSKYRRENTYQIYFEMAKQQQMVYRYQGKIALRKYRYITANSNTLNEKGFQTNKKRTQLSVNIKDNCSAEEAKNIQDNWNIRFIVDIDIKEHMDLSTKPLSYYLPIAKVKMIIIYNKSTNEIYKVIY